MTWRSDTGHGRSRASIGRRLLTPLAASALLALILTAVVALPWRTPRVQAQTCGTSWTNASGGDWFIAGNWSAGVPTATTGACISLPGTYTVSLSGDGVAQSLTIGGGGSTPTLQILGATCCNASLTVQSGLTNSGTIALDSLIDGRNAVLVLNTGTLTNNGTITVGANGTTGARTITANLSNTASGTITINQDTSFNKSSATYTNAATLTVAAGKTLSLTGTPTFNQSGGSLTLNGSFTMLSGGSFVFTGGAITGTPRFQDVALTLNTANAATFQMRGDNNTLTGDVSASQTLNVLAESCCNAGLTAATGSINNGTITLDSLIDGRNAVLVVSTGTLTNNGTIAVGASGTIGARTIRANLSNSATGTISINQNTSFDKSGATYTNAGTLTVAAGKTLTLTGAPAFNQTIGSLTLNGSFLQDGGSFVFTDGVITGTPRLTNVALTLNTPNAATFQLTGDGNTLTGDVSAGQTLNVLATAETFCCNATLTAATGFTNNGTITLDSLLDGRFAALVVSSGLLTNAGTLTVNATATGARTIGANLSNNASGTITINQDTSFNKSSATYWNDGTLTVAAGKTLSLTGAPTFNQSGGSLTLNGSFTMLSGGSFVFTGGAITGTPRFQDVALTLNTPNAATFQLTGDGNTLTGDVSAGQTLNVLATAETFCCNATLTAATGFTNNGTITLDSLLDGRFAALVVSSGLLTNAGTLTVNATGAGGGRTISAQLYNLGTFTVKRDTTLQSTTAAQFNDGSGWWEVAGGTLTLPQLGSPASLANSATLLIDAGATLAITNGSLSNSGAGLILGSGTIVASVSNDAIVGPGSADGTSTGILTIQGSYSQTSNGTLYIELCGTTVGSGYDRLAVTGNATLAGTLTVTNTNPSLVCYFPLLTDSFRVLTFGSHSGDFIQPYTLPPLDAGLAWSSNLTATFLDLTVVAGAAPSGPRPAPRPVPSRPSAPHRS